ncbi:hypothetical protein Fmac_004727 [Flemingia macrophylla]|uniref:Uncharacterized protein n=1 Tax=Flemingia macrophylla TaxID=520843 RepID=A0ABD1N6P4_9FABA
MDDMQLVEALRGYTWFGNNGGTYSKLDLVLPLYEWFNYAPNSFKQLPPPREGLLSLLHYREPHDSPRQALPLLPRLPPPERLRHVHPPLLNGLGPQEEHKADMNLSLLVDAFDLVVRQVV